MSHVKVTQTTPIVFLQQSTYRTKTTFIPVLIDVQLISNDNHFLFAPHQFARSRNIVSASYSKFVRIMAQKTLTVVQRTYVPSSNCCNLNTQSTCYCHRAAKKPPHHMRRPFILINWLTNKFIRRWTHERRYHDDGEINLSFSHFACESFLENDDDSRTLLNVDIRVVKMIWIGAWERQKLLDICQN